MWTQDKAASAREPDDEPVWFPQVAAACQGEGDDVNDPDNDGDNRPDSGYYGMGILRWWSNNNNGASWSIAAQRELNAVNKAILVDFDQDGYVDTIDADATSFRPRGYSAE